MIGDKALRFAFLQGVQFFAIDGGGIHTIVLASTLRSFGYPLRVASG